jgi:hypothetical protein
MVLTPSIGGRSGWEHRLVEDRLMLAILATSLAADERVTLTFLYKFEMEKGEKE